MLIDCLPGLLAMLRAHTVRHMAPQVESSRWRFQRADGHRRFVVVVRFSPGSAGLIVSSVQLEVPVSKHLVRLLQQLSKVQADVAVVLPFGHRRLPRGTHGLRIAEFVANRWNGMQK